MGRPFDRKMMAYCVTEDLTKRKISNCYKLIAEYNGGQYTALQFVTLKAMLKTMRKRVTEKYPELLNHFDYLFSDILSIDPFIKEA